MPTIRHALTPGPLRVAIVLAVLAQGACAHLPASRYAEARKARYFEAHREISPAIAEAIVRGHVIAGMDQEQVKVVLGEPVRTTRFERQPPIDVWIYQWYKLHQDQVRAGSTHLFRLVFVGGRLTVVEPL